MNITGALADLSSTCTQTTGTCTDTSNILRLSQNYAAATGALLNIVNAGTGNAIQIDTNEFVVSSTGAVTAAGNINTTGGVFQLNGTDINTAGTLTNVAYENQANTFTLANTFQGNLTVTNAGYLATQRATDYSTTGSANDVNLGAGSLVRLTGASTQTITGITGGADGRLLTIVNAAGQAGHGSARR
jgi:hypothetical protein